MNTLTTVRRWRTRGHLAAYLAMAALPVGLLSIASPADAAVLARTTTAYIGGGTNVNVRTSPQIASGNVAYVLPVNYSIQIVCQVAGGRLNFSQYAENRTWDLLSDGRWVHDAVTTTPADLGRVYLSDGGYVRYSSSIPRCGSTASSKEERAAQWAESMVGKGTSYSGLCERYVENAFGTSGRYYSARTNYQAQYNAGRIHTDTNVPRGALAFYAYGSLGHVGVGLGNGRVASSKLNGAVRVTPVTGWGLTYLGWSYAPASWPGR